MTDDMKPILFGANGAVISGTAKVDAPQKTIDEKIAALLAPLPAEKAQLIKDILDEKIIPESQFTKPIIPDAIYQALKKLLIQECEFVKAVLLRKQTESDKPLTPMGTVISI